MHLTELFSRYPARLLPHPFCCFQFLLPDGEGRTTLEVPKSEWDDMFEKKSRRTQGHCYHLKMTQAMRNRIVRQIRLVG